MDKPRILIVEDDLDLAEMLNAYFSVQNYDILTAAWGQEALTISRREALSLIMLDIRLPDIDGYDVCRQLRSQRRTQHVPIIFLTEKRDRVDKLQGLELGVVDYITKPFDIQELRLRVRNALNRARQQSLINPVTDLPELQLLEERFEEVLAGDQPWSLLLLSILGLGELRAVYGFVAADEMLRALTLMVRNALRELGNENDFMGHLEPESIVIVTTTDRVETIRERIQKRITQSIEHFYRPQEREARQTDYLRLEIGNLDHTSGPHESVEALKSALSATVSPHEADSE
ncbi:MAG: response regulator [Chloroflexi bacterium]|nr:response regulator [Chloroflexota bacterium]